MLGPSGCGKTTTLRMIAGFEEPSEGRVLLAGRDVTRIPASKRPVNMVFQAYALFPHMTVWDNVAFGLKVARVNRGEVDEARRGSAHPGQARRLREAQAGPALGRAAAARRSRAGSRQPAGGAPSGRAARRARLEAPQRAPARAEAHPGGDADDLRLCHARSGGGAHDVRPHRGHGPGHRRAGRDAARAVRAAGHAVRRGLHRCLEHHPPPPGRTRERTRLDEPRRGSTNHRARATGGGDRRASDDHPAREDQVRGGRGAGDASCGDGARRPLPRLHDAVHRGRRDGRSTRRPPAERRGAKAPGGRRRPGDLVVGGRPQLRDRHGRLRGGAEGRQRESWRSFRRRNERTRRPSEPRVQNQEEGKREWISRKGR